MSETKVRTGKVRFGYLRVLEPYQGENDKEPKYSAMIIIDKTDKKTLDAFKSAFEAAKKQGVEKLPKWGGKVPGGVKLPIRDGDQDKPDSPELAGKYFINVKANVKFPPQIVKKENGVFVKITDPLTFQSGDYGYAVLNLFPYSSNGNNGVSAGLNSICFAHKGDPLSGGGGNVNDDYADLLEAEDEEDDNSWMG